MKINADGLDHKQLNEKIFATDENEIVIENCLGQRFIAAGLGGKTLEIYGVPGNALGCYLDGSVIRVHGNAQDATGDTMNEGKIYIHGSCGDAPGYAMRGGKIFIKGDVGYRVGIHMKAYLEKLPTIVIGGKAGGNRRGERRAVGRTDADS